VSDPRKMSDEELAEWMESRGIFGIDPFAVWFHGIASRLRSLAKMREALEKIDLWCGCHLSPGSHGDSCPSVIARRALEESDV
jgi:hypothetical protein